MSEDSQFSEEGGWIQWFCSLEDHFFFCEVDADYIKDSFNLYGTIKLTFINFIIYSRSQTKVQQFQRSNGNDSQFRNAIRRRLRR